MRESMVGQRQLDQPDCLDCNVLVVRSAKQDAGLSKPETDDASPLLGNKQGLNIKMFMQCFEALNAESNDKTWSAVFKILSLDSGVNYE